MGMAASQARLLSITARLSNNEMDQQSVAYSKQRLADQTEQISDNYLDAMNETKYQFINGYDGSEPNYVDLTYDAITGAAALDSGKQYIVKTNQGKILVSNAIATAYKKYNGDYNKYLKDLGYTQSDINIPDDNDTAETKETMNEEAEEAIHDAWDKYLVSVGKSIDDKDDEHITNFGWTQFDGSTDILDGYATYETAYTTTKTVDGEEKPVTLYKDSDGYYSVNDTLTAMMNGDTGINEVGYMDDNGNFKSLGKYTYTTEDGKSHEVLTSTEENDKTGENDTIKYYYKDDNGEEHKLDMLKEFAKEEPKIKYEAKVTYDANTDKYTWGEKEYDTLYYNTLATEENNAISVESRNHTIEGEVTTSYKPLNYEGSTTAQRELYDYALSITEAYYNNTNHASTDLTYDSAMITYYKNIFNEMRTCGYITVDTNNNYGSYNADGEFEIEGHYTSDYSDNSSISTTSVGDVQISETKLFRNSDWFINALKSGELVMSYYSTVNKTFVSTTIDDDESVTEIEDSSSIALAEQVYEQQMNKIESQDKQFDLQLNRLESEHNALQTEYDSVKSVLSKNVESSFKTFSA